VPITLPNLDDLDWTQLTAEGRLLVPASAPEWTNHNASDPGITLVELFAHLAEMLFYRVNRTSDANAREFLQLIDGNRRTSSRKDLHDDIRTTVAGLREICRAVTPSDFVTLAMGVNKDLHFADEERVARVNCIALRNLESDDPADKNEDAPGHVSLVVVSNRRAPPSTALLRAVRHALEPARLLTTRIHVVRPRFVTCSVRLTLVPRANVMAETIRDEAVQALEKFFDPLQGGFDGQGWPFGRSVYVSEIYQLLDKLAGVDYITKSRNPATGDDMDELLIGPGHAKRLRWNAMGELEAIALDPDELVGMWVDRADITVADL
jgi:hypothetical protein